MAPAASSCNAFAVATFTSFLYIHHRQSLWGSVGEFTPNSGALVFFCQRGQQPTSSSPIAERPRCRVGGKRYSLDIIDLSSTTFILSACKAIEFGEITQNKSYYAVQGHARSPMSVPIESIIMRLLISD